MFSQLMIDNMSQDEILHYSEIDEEFRKMAAPLIANSVLAAREDRIDELESDVDELNDEIDAYREVIRCIKKITESFDGRKTKKVSKLLDEISNACIY